MSRGSVNVGEVLVVPEPVAVHDQHIPLGRGVELQVRVIEVAQRF